MITLDDVARAVGVSASTASRALAGRGGVRPELRERVRQAAAELGYRPNLNASNLRRGQSTTIGLVVPDIENPYFAEAARAIEDAAFARGFRVLLCNTGGHADRQRAYLDVLAAERVRGVVLVPSDPGGAEIGRLVDLGIPVVAFDRTAVDPRADAVVADNADGAAQAVRHLHAVGHRRIAFVEGRPGLQPSEERLAGYRAAIARLGLSAIVVDGWNPGRLGRGAAEELLDRQAATACIVANSVMTMGLLEVVRERGCRIPQDLAVVMFEDARWARLLETPLSAVALPGRRMGDGAIRLLLDREPGVPPTARTLVFGVEVRIRPSSGGAAHKEER